MCCKTALLEQSGGSAEDLKPVQTGKDGNEGSRGTGLERPFARVGQSI